MDFQGLSQAYLVLSATLSENEDGDRFASLLCLSPKPAPANEQRRGQEVLKFSGDPDFVQRLIQQQCLPAVIDITYRTKPVGPKRMPSKFFLDGQLKPETQGKFQDFIQKLMGNRSLQKDDKALNFVVFAKLWQVKKLRGANIVSVTPHQIFHDDSFSGVVSMQLSADYDHIKQHFDTVPGLAYMSSYEREQGGRSVEYLAAYESCDIGNIEFDDFMNTLFAKQKTAPPAIPPKEKNKSLANNPKSVVDLVSA